MDEKDARTLGEINEVLHLAKLNEESIIPTSQTIYFIKENFNNTKYKLLELDQHLHEAIKKGETLYIKGDEEESVVLCTKNRTYDVTLGETSNSLLLVNEMKFMEDLKNKPERSHCRVTVSSIFYEYLAISSGKPHIHKLLDLLNKSTYKGPELEYEIKEDDLYSYEDLNQRVQSSEEELKQVLATLNVVVVNGKVRLLDFEYHFRCLTYMLQLIDENSWSLDQIDFDETVTALRDIVPDEVLTSLFDKYTEESQIIDSQQLYRYKVREVCRFFAEVLLYGARKLPLHEFLQAWRESIPDGMEADEQFLYGISLIDQNSNPNIIYAFPEDQLPEDVCARFEALFAAKEKWTVPEIIPYVERLATSSLNANALLAKHARASTVDGIKYYSAKHAK